LFFLHLHRDHFNSTALIMRRASLLKPGEGFPLIDQEGITNIYYKGSGSKYVGLWGSPGISVAYSLLFA
jgi:hypothetical protein